MARNIFSIASSFLIVITIIFISNITESASAQLIYDDDFVIEKFTEGLNFPTTMTFIDNEILILEKNSGKVIRIHENGVHYDEPVLDVGIAYGGEAGMLGIASNDNHIYLYYTKSCQNLDMHLNENSHEKYGELGLPTCIYDDNSDIHGFENTKNSLYQYDWDGKKLINPVLLKELPALGSDHHGGIITINENNEIYFVIGDQNSSQQDIPDFVIASILKIDNDDIQIFATGIRNSFGLAIDPITGNLWDTENGYNTWDEINLVTPNFNSGWTGAVDQGSDLEVMGPNNFYNDLNAYPSPFSSSGKFVYSDPEFAWEKSIGVTAISFPNNDGFGKYSDWLFVGDVNNGRIYKFELNEDRTGFIFRHPDLLDLTFDKTDEKSDYEPLQENKGSLTFAKQEITKLNDGVLDSDRGGMDEILFVDNIHGRVVDIKFHNGEMYVVSIFDGVIYKISIKHVLRPLQQYQNDIIHKQIVCKKHLIPIMSFSNGVNCVNPSTALTLAGRTNWTLNHSEIPLIKFQNQQLQKLNFENTNLNNSNFKGTVFTDVKFSNVNFTGANLQNIVFSDVDLLGVNLSGADLSDANLSRVNLSGVNLSDANLSGADLSDANLSGVNLSGTDLSDANFSGVNLSGADFRN